MRSLCVALACLLLAGCGTFRTRGYNGAVFGKYPLAAAYYDLDWIAEICRTQSNQGIGERGWGIALMGLVCLPLDFAVDVVASPLDLAGWVLGFDRDATRGERAQDARTEGQEAADEAAATEGGATSREVKGQR